MAESEFVKVAETSEIPPGHKRCRQWMVLCQVPVDRGNNDHDRQHKAKDRMPSHTLRE